MAERVVMEGSQDTEPEEELDDEELDELEEELLEGGQSQVQVMKLG